MSTDLVRPKATSKAGYVFGGLSFVPFFGVLFGIVAIVIGAINGTRKVAFLGMGGIAFNVVLYGSLFYFGFVLVKTDFFQQMRIKLASQIITMDADQLVLYRQQHGALPKTLLAIPASSSFMPSDPWGKPLGYKPNEDGTFELRSAGPDGEFNTADDIVQNF